MLASAEFERTLVLVSAAVLVSGSVGWFICRDNSQRADTMLAIVLTLSVAIFAAAIIGRWYREAQGPFLTLYDVLLSNLFSLSLIYLLIQRRLVAIRVAAGVVLPFLSILCIWLISAEPEAIPLPATFNNHWLWLHVISGKIFFGLMLASAAGAFWLLFFRHTSEQYRQALATDDAVWQLASVAFVFHSFMLLAGAVWAHSAWGRYWAWDSLETWTLVTWLALALVLHGRLTYKRLADRFWWFAVLIVFCLAFLTFLGIPFVSVAPHKGIM